MNLALTILQREATLLPRRRWFYLKRMAFAGAGGAVILFALLVSTASGSTTAGLKIFASFSTTVLLATCIISALTSGLALMREKKDRTLGLLFLTDMSCAQQIQSRFTASIAFMLLTVCSLFPMFVLSASLGGISPAQIAAVFTVLIGMIFAGCSIGLLAATVCQTERSMVLCGGLIAGILFGGLPAAVAIWSSGGEKSIAAMHVVSSFAVMASISAGQMVIYGLWNCLFNVAVSVPMLLITGAVLPKAIFSEESAASGGVSIFRRLWVSSGAAARLHRPIPVRHAVAARDSRFVHGGYRREAMACIAVSAALGLISHAAAMSMGTDIVDASITAFSTVAGVNTLIFGLATVLRGARTIRRENENRTMPLLLATPLSDSEIVWGKLRAVFASTLPWFIAAITCGILAGALTWEFAAVAVALGSGFYVVSTVFAVTCTAMLLSLWFNTPALLGICFPVFLVWNSMFKWQLMAVSAVFSVMLSSLLSNVSELLAGTVVLISVSLTAVLPDIGIGLGVIYILKKSLRKRAANL